MNLKIEKLFIDIIGVLPEELDLKKNDIREWDSLRHFELILALQKEFDLKFLPDELALLDSYQNILSVVSEKIKKKQADG